MTTTSLATFRGAMTDALARRASFYSQVSIMVVNDLAWIVFWVIFFRRVDNVRGWNVDTVLLLYATLTTSAGLVLGLLSNARRIPQIVDDGSLDHVLTLPVTPLPQLLVRKIDPVNLGDVAFGLVLFAAVGHPTLPRVAVYLFAVACSALVLTGFLVATGSIAFFAGRSQGGDLSLHAMLMLASYPASIFTGYTKGLLFTVVPAAFVSSVPSSLVDEFSWPAAAALAAAALVFATLGWTVFSLGLRRYTSGSGWTRA
jgi:ABC-2 type transport system permease protein